MTCWEVLTRACIPYPTIDPVSILKHLESGNRMDKPTHCPGKLYEIMLHCWESDAENRPTFREIRPNLDSILSQRRKPEKKRDRMSEPFQNNSNQSNSLTKHHYIERSKTEAGRTDFRPENRYVPGPTDSRGFSTQERAPRSSSRNKNIRDSPSSRSSSSADNRHSRRPVPKERSSRPRWKVFYMSHFFSISKICEIAKKFGQISGSIDLMVLQFWSKSRNMALKELFLKL